MVLYVASDVITTWGGSFSVESAKKNNESAKKKSEKKAKARRKRAQKMLQSTYLHIYRTNQAPERGGGGRV